MLTKDKFIPYSLSFIFGGVLMLIIYIAANEYKNGIISALIALLPLSLICCYAINTKDIVLKHSYNLIPIILLTVVATYVLIGLLEYTSSSIIFAVSISLVIWVLLQYLRIAFFIKK